MGSRRAGRAGGNPWRIVSVETSAGLLVGLILLLGAMGLAAGRVAYLEHRRAEELQRRLRAAEAELARLRRPFKGQDLEESG